jgi:hypothetical protein
MSGCDVLRLGGNLGAGGHDAECPLGPAGVGGGSAAGGEESYAFCSDPCIAKCGPIGAKPGFSASIFAFATTIPDDGTDKGGGWQVASANLKFVRWTSTIPEAWVCPLTVGMPLRTAINGTISPEYAATITAGIATDASSNVKNSSPDLPPGIFCSKLKPKMQTQFDVQYGSVGAKMM